MAERERARQDTRTREAQQREAQQRAQQQETSARQQALQQQQREFQLRQQQTQQAQQQAQQQARQQPDRSLAVDQSAATRQKNSQIANKVGLPSAQELQKIPLDQLASMPKEQLANLPPDRQRNLNNYVAAKANAAKYEAEANKSIASRFVKELPRQTVNVTAGAVVGVGQVAVETGKTAFQAGQRVGTPIGNAVGTVVGDALFDPKALPRDIRGGAKTAAETVRRDTAKVIQEGVEVYQNPKKSAREVGSVARNVVTEAGRAVSSGAANYVDSIQRGDGYEAGRIVGRTTATAGLIVGGAPSGTAAKEVGAIVRGAEKQTFQKEATAAAAKSSSGETKQLANTEARTSVQAEQVSNEASKRVVGLRNENLAGSVHPKTGIPFDKNGYPNFSSVTKTEVKITQVGTRAGDFRAANAAAGFKSTPEGYTWHHHQDGTTMQLVPRDIHAQTGHTGGFESKQ